MDIFDNITHEHAELKGLMEKLEDNKKPVSQNAITFYTFAVKLISHAKAEYITLYTRLTDDDKTEDSAMQADHEHVLVERILQDLMATNMNSEIWSAKLAILKENLVHHMEEEEKNLFSEAKEVLSDSEAEEMGEAYSMEKDKLEQELSESLINVQIKQ